VHKVESLGVHLPRVAEMNRGSVVDADIDTTEVSSRRLDRGFDRFGIPHVECKRQGVAPATTSRAALWIVPSSFGCGSTVLAAMTTFAPSRAARSAIARPMLRLAPVMNRVRPASVRPGVESWFIDRVP